MTSQLDALDLDHTPAGSEPEVVLDMPARPFSSKTARCAVERFVHQYHHGLESIGEFLIAVGEALANAIEHSASEDSITIRMRLSGSLIIVSVTDRGIGFVAESITMFDLPNPDSENGRGLPIMKQCTDFFKIESAVGQGTTVVLGMQLLPEMGVRKNRE